MTILELVEKHKYICDQATEMKLYDALQQTGILLAEISTDELWATFHNCQDTYSNILKYTAKGIADPQREAILHSLVVSIVEMADKIKEHYLEKNNNVLHERKINAYKKLAQVQQKLNEAIESSDQHIKMLDLLDETDIEIDNKDLLRKQQLFQADFFTYILYADKLSDADVLFVRNVFDLKNIEWYEKCLMVTAATISMMRYFDTKKMELLFYFYESGVSQVRQRSLAGILILFLLYDERVKYYSLLNDKIQKIYAENRIEESEMLILIKQLIKARDTEKISKRMTEDIIPNIRKITPKIEEKLDLDNLYSDESFLEKNPDWQSILEDSPELMDKIEEMSKMQLEGNDVFMSAFSMLKHFDFFKEISNWFVPFYKENPEISAILNNEDKKFREVFSASLERSSYMCNSDKYSFMLNLTVMPEQQKNLLLNMFNAELESINEVNDQDEMLYDLVKSQTSYTQYIQDLYRFFKLHPDRKNFEDVFTSKLDFHGNTFLKTVFHDHSFFKKVADFLFKTDHYDEALEVFLKLYDEKNLDFELVQKIGYCYQQVGNYSEALDYYYKAELFDSSNIWNLKKIAFCLVKQNNYEKAIEYYFEIEKLDPSNVKVMMNIANAYLNQKQFSKALNYYYKIEFTTNENTGIYRPIAWCLFVLGQIEKSKEYFQKLFDIGNPNKYDYMNIGHVNFVERKFGEAADYYLKSMRQKDNSVGGFMNGFTDDIEYLLEQGVKDQEIQLMIDYLKYNF